MSKGSSWVLKKYISWRSLQRPRSERGINGRPSSLSTGTHLGKGFLLLQQDGQTTTNQARQKGEMMQIVARPTG